MSERVEASEQHPEPDFVAGLDAIRGRLEAIIGRPKLTSRDAEEASEAAKALADLLRGEERALRLIDKPAAASPPDAADGSLAGLTLHEAARRVLERAGWPMHVRDLGTRIKAAGWRHPRSRNARPDQIEYQLAARLPRHPETFVRLAPNTFGLALWGDTPPRPARPRPALGSATSRGPFDRLEGDELMHRYATET